MARRKTNTRKKTRPPFDLKRYLVGVLRKASYRYPERYQAVKNAKTYNGLYKCNICKNSFPRQDIQVDHIVPIVSITRGFTTFDDYIAAMFVKAEGLQVLCKPCHKIKTQAENAERRKLKKK